MGSSALLQVLLSHIHVLLIPLSGHLRSAFATPQLILATFQEPSLLLDLFEALDSEHLLTLNLLFATKLSREVLRVVLHLLAVQFC